MTQKEIKTGLALLLYILSALAAFGAARYAEDDNIERHSIHGLGAFAVDSPKEGGAAGFAILSGFLALSGTLVVVFKEPR